MTPSKQKQFIQGTLPLLLVSDIGAFIAKRDVRKLTRLSKYSLLVYLMGLKRFHKALVPMTFVIECLLKCFSWQFSLYILIRQTMKRFKSVNNILMSTLGIYLIHLVHNYLVIIEADRIEPSYLKLWIKTLPYYQAKGYKKWIEEFGLKASSSKYYKTEQVCEKRLNELPRNIFKSFTFQLPFVIALYGLGFAFSLRNNYKTITSDVLKGLLFGLGTKIVRTSVVLSLLPYSLCSFPVVYANKILPLIKTVEKDEDGNKKVKRNPVLHIGFASILSTWVFLQEPKGRLRMMMGYTVWRIFEALLRTTVLTRKNNKIETFASAFLISLAVKWT